MRPLSFLALITLVAILANGVGAQPPAKGKPDPKAKVDPKAKAEPEAALNMKMKTSDIRMGATLLGPKLDVADLKDHVVLVDYWGIACPPCLEAMPRLADLNAELGDFGLIILGSHMQDGEADKVRAAALQRRTNYPISTQTFVRGSEDHRFLPHCLLFDHTGACVFRGKPGEAEAHLRKAVGAALVAAAGRDKFSATAEPIVKELKGGKAPLSVLPKVAAMRNFTGDAGACSPP